MRLLFLAGVIAVGLALALLPVPPRAAAPAPAAQAATQTASDTVTPPVVTPTIRQYSRIRWGMYFVGTAYGLAALGAVLASGISKKLCRWVCPWKFSLLRMAGYYAALTGVLLLVKAPLTWYSGYYLSHAYGLSSQSFLAWLGDLFKGVGVDLLTTIPLLWGLYWLIQRSPRRWALWAWVALIPVIAFGIFASPIFIDPLFNKFTPLPPGQLHDRIEALAAKAGIPDAPILVADKSKQTHETNAYVTGIGSSARIVIWDTTLQQMPEDQIVAIVGHEMGHYVLKHIYWGFALSVGGLLVLLPLAKLSYESLLRRYGTAWGIHDGPGDYAAVPALLLTAALFSFFLAPVTNAVSREIEHQADAYGLSVTANRPAMARAFVSLSEQNLSDPNPPAFIKFWLFTHPPLSERIDFALGRKSRINGE